jgi:uncharacterized lipoprotein YddW (UPF0748 family)
LSSLLFIALSRRYLSPLLVLCTLLAVGLPACSPGAPPEPAGGPDSSATAGDPALPQPVPETRARPRGLWILAEGSQRVLEDPSRLAPLLATAETLGASDLFVQVYRGGRSWYASDLADATPYREQLERTGVDTLARLITEAHAQGLRVHAWVNVLSLSSRRSPPILERLGPQAVLVDRAGRSILDYPNLEIPAPDGDWYRMGTRGVYLDAGFPGVAEELAATFGELLTRYPDLDGLHLDYVRYPGVLPFVPGSRFGVGLDFGYGAETRQRFNEETALTGPYRDPSQPESSAIINSNAWDAWRRDKVSEVVAAIADRARSVRPGVVLSAAVISYVDRAYLSLFQDWPRWLEDGLIDLAIPMVYTLDERLLRYQLEHFGRGLQRDQIWSGLGVWLFARSPERARAQVEIARSAGLVGEVLFSYDAIAESPELEASLARTLAGGEVPAAP